MKQQQTHVGQTLRSQGLVGLSPASRLAHAPASSALTPLLFAESDNSTEEGGSSGESLRRQHEAAQRERGAGEGTVYARPGRGEVCSKVRSTLASTLGQPRCRGGVLVSASSASSRKGKLWRRTTGTKHWHPTCHPPDQQHCPYRRRLAAPPASTSPLSAPQLAFAYFALIRTPFSIDRGFDFQVQRIQSSLSPLCQFLPLCAASAIPHSSLVPVDIQTSTRLRFCTLRHRRPCNL